jgi:multidrug transporter EmrE-like cation transporter
METIIVMALSGATITIGDLFSGKWVKTDKKLFYALAFLFYIIGSIFLIYTYKSEDIVIATMVVEIINLVTLTLAGRFIFKENISKMEIIGIAIGLVALVILELA